MRFAILTAILGYVTTTTAELIWSLEKAPTPSEDEADAYQRIESVMEAAVARYSRISDASKEIHVYYDPGVPTAEANYNGDLRFGSNRSYMTERTALHEISHTLGVGQTDGFNQNCENDNWPTATPLLQSWDGPDAKINCGGGHFWPYGPNQESEWSETNADRNIQMVDAMRADGM